VDQFRLFISPHIGILVKMRIRVISPVGPEESGVNHSDAADANRGKGKVRGFSPHKTRVQ
jgi:hypothetical protein